MNGIHPIFFVSSNNTSDCSESEDQLREHSSKIYESTPYRPTHQHSNLIETKEQIEDVLSNISSSGSNTPEQSFDVKDILRQVNETRNGNFSYSFFYSLQRLVHNRVKHPTQVIQRIERMKIESSNKLWTNPMRTNNRDNIRRFLYLTSLLCLLVVVLFKEKDIQMTETNKTIRRFI